MPDDAAAVDEAKRVLRARMRTIRTAIAADEDDRARRSTTICAGVISTIGDRLESARPWRVLVYAPLPGEPDLAELVAWCAANWVATYLPEVDGDSLRVVPGNLAPTLLDIVVVPGVAFTADGRRLGQGGGHFDRFLPRLRSDCLRLGVAFREQLVDDLPTSPHDSGLDVVITD